MVMALPLTFLLRNPHKELLQAWMALSLFANLMPIVRHRLQVFLQMLAVVVVVMEIVPEPESGTTALLEAVLAVESTVWVVVHPDFWALAVRWVGLRLWWLMRAAAEDETLQLRAAEPAWWRCEAKTWTAPRLAVNPIESSPIPGSVAVTKQMVASADQQLAICSSGECLDAPTKIGASLRMTAARKSTGIQTCLPASVVERTRARQHPKTTRILEEESASTRVVVIAVEGTLVGQAGTEVLVVWGLGPMAIRRTFTAWRKRPTRVRSPRSLVAAVKGKARMTSCLSFLLSSVWWSGLMTVM
mmetsp:Transcript_8097/g.17429  ORF Transcript_8097/g.17429 Transcript_8097/m.17429 type:complete len:302 (+) Transcript_8097:635-1540(+)